MTRHASKRTYRTRFGCLATCAVLVAAFLLPSDGLAAHAGIKRPAAALSFPELHPALPKPRGPDRESSVRQAVRALPALKGVLALRGGDEVAGMVSSRSESPSSLKQKKPLAPAAPAAVPASAPQQIPAAGAKTAPAGGATLADLFSALSGPGPSSSVGNGAAAQARRPPPITPVFDSRWRQRPGC